jgi:hypothetical protein
LETDPVLWRDYLVQLLIDWPQPDASFVPPALLCAAQVRPQNPEGEWIRDDPDQWQATPKQPLPRQTIQGKERDEISLARCVQPHLRQTIARIDQPSHSLTLPLTK